MQRSKSVVRKKMLRSKSIVGRRAWNILRLALLWARKGGVFLDLKKRLFHQNFLNHFHSTSHFNGNKGNGALQYGDRQLSFDATPMIHIRMHRPNSMRFRLPHIPCINPHSNDHMFDFDDEIVDYDDYYQPRKSFLIGNGQQEDDDEDEEEEDYQPRKSFLIENGQEEEQEEDEIDLKAEQFIANFYEQLKLQRQYNQTRRTSIDQ